MYYNNGMFKSDQWCFDGPSGVAKMVVERQSSLNFLRDGRWGGLSTKNVIIILVNSEKKVNKYVQ